MIPYRRRFPFSLVWVLLLVFSCAILAMPSMFADNADTEKAEKASVPPLSPPGKGFWISLRDFFLPHRPARNVILEKETEYHKVAVEDDELGFRHLVFLPDHGSQGVIAPAQPDVIIDNFMKYAFLAMPALGYPPRRVLFIGLGAGIMPRFLAGKYKKVKIDVVEIDPDIPEIARKFFGFEGKGGTTVIIQDGRVFLNRLKGKKYDIVFLDAFNATGIPFQLTTKEFYIKARDALAPGGVLAVNIANLGDPKFLGNELKTVLAVFRHVAVTECPRASNYVLFASEKPLFEPKPWRKAAAKFDAEHKWDFKLAPYLDSLYPPEKIENLAKKSKIMTDDFAPVD